MSSVSSQQGAGEGEEPGGGAQRPPVSLPGPNAVGQDSALRWRLLPAGVHGPGGVSVGERPPLQPHPLPPSRPAQTTGYITPPANHAPGPTHSDALSDGPEQPRLHKGEPHPSQPAPQQPDESR